MDIVTSRPQLRTSVSSAQEPLPDFDLSFVNQRVAREQPDWDEKRLANAELEYRLFLARHKAEPRLAHSPSRDADEFWHAHILHTKEYARDCESYFGYFVHHVPLDENDCGGDGECKTQCHLRPGKCNVEPNINNAH